MRSKVDRERRLVHPLPQCRGSSTPCATVNLLFPLRLNVSCACTARFHNASSTLSRVCTHARTPGWTAEWLHCTQRSSSFHWIVIICRGGARELVNCYIFSAKLHYCDSCRVTLTRVSPFLLLPPSSSTHIIFGFWGVPRCGSFSKCLAPHLHENRRPF